jgi:hypothetical protein
MENLEALSKRGLRAYQLGRLRMAAKVALLLAPVVAVCLLEPVGRETCACSALLLLAAAIGMRFRDRRGVESVTTGLVAGGVPLAAVWLLSRLDSGCAAASAVSYCTAFSVLIGGGAGAVVGLREARGRSGHWLAAATIALLAASLGCARLGIASVVGVTLGIVLGRTTAIAGRRTA